MMWKGGGSTSTEEKEQKTDSGGSLSLTMVDWALMGWMNPAKDIALCLAYNLEPADRREWYDALLERYWVKMLETVEKTGGAGGQGGAAGWNETRIVVSRVTPNEPATRCVWQVTPYEVAFLNTEMNWMFVVNRFIDLSFLLDMLVQVHTFTHTHIHTHIIVLLPLLYTVPSPSRWRDMPVLLLLMMRRATEE